MEQFENKHLENKEQLWDTTDQVSGADWEQMDSTRRTTVTDWERSDQVQGASQGVSKARTDQTSGEIWERTTQEQGEAWDRTDWVCRSAWEQTDCTRVKDWERSNELYLVVLCMEQEKLPQIRT